MTLTHLLLAIFGTAVVAIPATEFLRHLGIDVAHNSFASFAILFAAMPGGLSIAWLISCAFGLLPMGIGQAPCPHCNQKQEGWRIVDWANERRRKTPDAVTLQCSGCSGRTEIWINHLRRDRYPVSGLPAFRLAPPKFLGIWRRLPERGV